MIPFAGHRQTFTKSPNRILRHHRRQPCHLFPVKQIHIVPTTPSGSGSLVVRGELQAGSREKIFPHAFGRLQIAYIFAGPVPLTASPVGMTPLLATVQECQTPVVDQPDLRPTWPSHSAVSHTIRLPGAVLILARPPSSEKQAFAVKDSSASRLDVVDKAKLSVHQNLQKTIVALVLSSALPPPHASSSRPWEPSRSRPDGPPMPHASHWQGNDGN